MQGIPVPGLTRDLRSAHAARVAGRSPGSSPGRDSLSLSHGAPKIAHGALCLHHGLSALWSNLHWSNGESRDKGGGSQGRFVDPYGEVKYQDPGLVRAARRFRCQPAARAGDKALAARLEERIDRRVQSELAGPDGVYSGLAYCPPVSSRFNGRSRVKSGTGISFTNFTACEGAVAPHNVVGVLA